MIQEPTRIFDLLTYQKATHPLAVALAGKRLQKWVTFSTDEYKQLAWGVAAYLLRQGVQSGDRIATISNNRPEWSFVDMGALLAGCVHVPLYPNITLADYHYIFGDCKPAVLFVEGKALYAKLRETIGNAASIKLVVSFDEVPGTLSFWNEIQAFPQGQPQPQIEACLANTLPTQLATIVYTSGTTGNPKGVMLSHQNILSNLMACRERVPVGAGNIALSFLPMCHCYERLLVYIYTYFALSVYFADKIESVGESIREVRPHIFTTVPRLLEKVYERIEEKGKGLGGMQKRIFDWAMQVAERYEFGAQQGLRYNAERALADRLVYRKWREAIGGNISVIVSGAASLSPRLMRIFWAAKIAVIEGYGLTETSPVISVGYWKTGQLHFGTVGLSLKNIEVSFTTDGEILVRGPNVMLGYLNQPELTREAIDEDGWLHTGDVGEFTQEGLLRITDRKKEMFKTATGKYIAPQQIESLAKNSLLIQHMMVMGENEKFVGAFIVPDWDHVVRAMEAANLPMPKTKAESLTDKNVLGIFRKEIAVLNISLAEHEQVKKFQLMPTEWSVDGGELTPTLKMKRKYILRKYGAFEEAMFPKA